MTLAYDTDRLETERLVLRRITHDDLPFFTRIHALPAVAEHLYPAGRPRSSDETAAWMRYTLRSYEKLALGSLAVVRKDTGALRRVAERAGARLEGRMEVVGLTWDRWLWALASNVAS